MEKIINLPIRKYLFYSKGTLDAFSTLNTFSTLDAFSTLLQ